MLEGVTEKEGATEVKDMLREVKMEDLLLDKSPRPFLDTPSAIVMTAMPALPELEPRPSCATDINDVDLNGPFSVYECKSCRDMVMDSLKG